jgi:CRP/FNR family transcriptional regulator
MKPMLDDVREFPLEPTRGSHSRSGAFDMRAPRAPAVERELHLAPRTLIFLEGQGRIGVPVIAGVVMLYKLLPDGRRQIVEVLGDGDVFGFSPAPVRNCTAETLAVTRCTSFDRTASALALTVQSPERSVRQFRHCTSIRCARAKTAMSGSRASMRCSPRWLRLSGTTPRRRRCQRAVMTWQEIADYLGLTIETVRVLDRLRAPFNQQLDEICIDVCRLCRLTGTHLTRAAGAARGFR